MKNFNQNIQFDFQVIYPVVAQVLLCLAVPAVYSYFYQLYVVSTNDFSKYIVIYLLSLIPVVAGELAGHVTFYKTLKETGWLILYLTEVIYTWLIATLIWSIAVYIFMKTNVFEYNFTSQWDLRFISEFTYYYFAESLLFYALHRTLHLPYVYKKIHCIHHQPKNLKYTDGDRLHPGETFMNALAMILPVFLPPIFLGHTTLYQSWLFFLFFRQFITTECHSEPSDKHTLLSLLPFYMKCEFHRFHHLSSMSKNFGYISIWDKLFKTFHIPKM